GTTANRGRIISKGNQETVFRLSIRGPSREPGEVLPVRSTTVVCAFWMGAISLRRGANLEVLAVHSYGGAILAERFSPSRKSASTPVRPRGPACRRAPPPLPGR